MLGRRRQRAGAVGDDQFVGVGAAAGGAGDAPVDDGVGAAGALRTEEGGHPAEDLVEDLRAGLAAHDLGDLGVKYPSSVIVTRRSYLVQNRPIVKKYLAAFTEGLHLYAQDKDFTLGIMQKYFKLKDREAMSRSHDYFVKNTTLVPLTDPVAIKNALGDKTGGRKLEDFYDNSLLQELVKEGFVDKLRKK